MPFPMQEQEMDLWCWAAVSASTDKYFDPQTTKTQCSIASAVKKTDCCANAAVCDQADSLRVALTRISRLRPNGFIEGIISFDDIRHELNNGLPVAARIAWFEGGGHFVVITGYWESASGARKVRIADPLFEGGLFSYNEFADAYLARGEWTHTYLLES